MKVKFKSIYHHTAFPISLLMIVSLAAGFFTFKDYGMSWDEPLFYNYADAIPYAYSITERLQGDFNILKAYGPSETDHMMYGPAYLLIARPFVQLTEFLTGSDSSSGWHLINFILFNIGILFFYLLCLRWMSRWAAFSAAILFITQPLIWGHSFINPKDIPFTVFFIITIYSGFKMVDYSSIPDQHSNLNPGQARSWKWIRLFLWVSFFAFLLANVSTIVFKPQIESLLPSLIRNAHEHPGTFLGTVFRLVTNNPSGSKSDDYITRGMALFRRSPIFLFLMTFLLGTLAFLATFASRFLTNIYYSIKVNISWWRTIAAGISLGILTAIRVLGPLAGLLVALFFVFKFRKRAISGLFIYGVIAFVVMFFLWPYLWHSPISGIVAVLSQMANNPQPVPILFAGKVISSTALPVSYFPTMLGLTLTEPVWILFIVGLGIAFKWMAKSQLGWKDMIPIVLWFFIPFLYVIISTPPQYDGFRHFTFIIPSVFIFIGFTFFKIFEINPYRWVNPIIVLLLVLPGVLGIVRLHPYEYTYYNSFTGGTKGAFRKFETDYWLTCYKEAFEKLTDAGSGQQGLFVYKNKYLATQYADDHFIVKQFDPGADTTTPGDILLMSTRTNYDLSFHKDDPALFTISRDGALFCSVKKIK
jgi:hypothetical protein